MNVTATHPETPPHAPEAGWVRRLLGPFHVTGVFWFRFHRFGVTVIPNWAMGLGMALFTTFFWICLLNIRKAIGANLQAVLGPSGWLGRQRRIFRTLHTFAWCLSERYERLSTDRVFIVEMEGVDLWRDLVESGKGFILVTAHMGAWEMGSMVPASQEMRRVHVVREAETDPRAQEFIARLIQSRGGEYYTTHFAADPQLGVTLLDALRQGEIVALQGDRPRSGGRVVETTLFGHPYPMPVGPAVLARAAEVPMVPVFIFREGRLRYRCVLRPPIHVGNGGDRQKATAEAMCRFAGDLEWAIRREPHQWFCFRRLWELSVQESPPVPYSSPCEEEMRVA
jgi:lauroyl/myristoyl acyltransferase